jgi:hypothetical protein
MDDAKPKVGLKVVAYAVIAGFLYGLAVRFPRLPTKLDLSSYVAGFHGVPSDRHRFITVFLIERQQPQPPWT